MVGWNETVKVKEGEEMDETNGYQHLRGNKMARWTEGNVIHSHQDLRCPSLHPRMLV